MEYVNKIVVKKPINSGELNLSIPIQMNFQNVDQYDIIKTEFVDVEVANSINPITDNEKVRCVPKVGNELAYEIIYNLNFLDSLKQYDINTTLAEIGFEDIDIKFRKKAYTQSFLRLSFYDSDNQLSQNLISFITLFPRLYKNDFSNQRGKIGQVAPANAISLRFIVGDSIKDVSKEGEGFFIYHYKDEINYTLPKELFMRASFNNAKTGKSTNLISTDKKVKIEELFLATNGTTTKNNVYTKYILTRDKTGYYYTIDLNYSNNVSVSNDTYIVNLFEIFAQ